LDLRLSDNHALSHASKNSDKVLPVFIWDVKSEGTWPLGGASRWWLHQSLERLDADLRKAGGELVIREGDTLDELCKLIKEADADSIVWNRRFDPKGCAQDEEIENALENDGIMTATFNSSLLHDPETMQTSTGGPFKVFTPFWHKFSTKIHPPPPMEKPKLSLFHAKKIESLPLDHLGLEPKIDWAAGLRETWQPGERGAKARLKHFIDHAITDYNSGRDRPALDGVSMISPHLHFGEISPRQIWHAVRDEKSLRGKQDAETYLKEIGWREFAHHVLFHFPQTADHPLREEFANFPWSNDRKNLKLWQKGLTGYPIVDAGMRQLWHTGWMHNRVRMIVASFLTKDLLVSWHYGAKWFWDTLVDADLPNNTLGWQWASGCGADAAPYFRIFNPVLQGEKFDPKGEYVREWIPELAKLPDKWIHQPWNAPPLILQSAKIALGEEYPHPLIEHGIARKRALEALSHVKTKKVAPARSG
jgi:deoxyribodipyrimidine photo-lyase